MSNNLQAVVDFALVILTWVSINYLKKAAPVFKQIVVDQIKSGVKEMIPAPTATNGNGNGGTAPVLLALVGSEAKRLDEALTHERHYTREQLQKNIDALIGYSVRLNHVEEDFKLVKAYYVDMSHLKDTQAAMNTRLEAIEKLVQTLLPPPDKGAVIPLDSSQPPLEAAS